MKPLTTRFAKKEDWPRILELHREQCKKWGTNYELPYFWSPNIPVALVAVDENGLIHEAFYVERTAELRFVGVNPRATAHLQRESRGLAYVLRHLGYRWLECFVPRKKVRRLDLVKSIAKPLQRAGFKDKTKDFAHFALDMGEVDE